jgi:hypothetical protein
LFSKLFWYMLWKQGSSPSYQSRTGYFVTLHLPPCTILTLFKGILHLVEEHIKSKLSDLKDSFST